MRVSRFASSIAVVMVSIACVPAHAEDPNGPLPEFVNPPLADLLERARSAKTHAALHVDAPCACCTSSHANPLEREDVQATLRGIPTAGYLEGNENADRVIERYRVRHFPTLLVLDGEGAEVDRIDAGIAPEAFVHELRRVLRDERTLMALRAMSPDERTPMDWAWLCVKLAKADPEEALRLADRLAGEKSGLDADMRAWMLLQRGEALGNLGRDEEALEAFERVVREHPQTGSAHYVQVQAVPVLLRVCPERALAFVGNTPATGDPALRAYVDFHLSTVHLHALAALYERRGAAAGDDPAALTAIAWECCDRGLLPDQALEWARRAVELSREPYTLGTLARVLYERDDDESLVEALALVREALEGATTEEDRRYYEERVAWFAAVKAVRDRS